jgi:glutamine synthetase
LPPTLLHAVDQLEDDAVVTGVLDAVGDGVAGYFAAIKRDEFFAYHSSVSPWEVEQYLTAF